MPLPLIAAPLLASHAAAGSVMAHVAALMPGALSSVASSGAQQILVEKWRAAGTRREADPLHPGEALLHHGRPAWYVGRWVYLRSTRAWGLCVAVTALKSKKLMVEQTSGGYIFTSTRDVVGVTRIVLKKRHR